MIPFIVKVKIIDSHNDTEKNGINTLNKMITMRVVMMIALRTIARTGCDNRSKSEKKKENKTNMQKYHQ